jgi:serine/threonine-protein kinase
MQNPHVVHLFDGGTLKTGEPFMVMEFVDGSDLFSILRAEGRMPSEKVVRYMLQVCEGLRAVHANGIVHCDVKPENLIRARTAEGAEIIKIVDFGVARQRGLPSLYSLASPGVICGSPNYMSPEQVQTLPDVDARSDIWALGIVMFELLTGRPPFVGSDENQICHSVLNDSVPSLASLGVSVPVELEVAITRCLQKAREERFQSVDELMMALAFVVLRQHGVKQPVADREAAVSPVDVPVTDEAPAAPAAGETDAVPLYRRRYLAQGIAAVVVLSALLWGRSDTSRDATSSAKARVTEAAR